jgi:AcrR family transcriptional regulator
LLETNEFSKISVQDVAEAATLNRATFYDHYPDKFALLDSMVADRFNELLSERAVVYDGKCSSALKAVVLGVCDFLAAIPRLECEQQAQVQPHLESAVIGVVQKMFVDGLALHQPESSVPLEIVATAASWAIYGAAKQWVHTPDRCSSEAIADVIVELVTPILTSKPLATT